MSDAEDINLYTVPTHDPAECDEFMARLRRERNQARNIAVALEQENADLHHRLLEQRNVSVAAYAKLTAHNIDHPTRDEIEGHAI